MGLGSIHGWLGRSGSAPGPGSHEYPRENQKPMTTIWAHHVLVFAMWCRRGHDEPLQTARKAITNTGGLIRGGPCCARLISVAEVEGILEWLFVGLGLGRGFIAIVGKSGHVFILA